MTTSAISFSNIYKQTACSFEQALFFLLLTLDAQVVVQFLAHILRHFPLKGAAGGICHPLGKGEHKFKILFHLLTAHALQDLSCSVPED